MKTLVRFKHVSFQYPGQKAPLFEDVSFSLCSGERVGLLGPNGSGKTTLLRLIFGDIQGTGIKKQGNLNSNKKFEPVEGEVFRYTNRIAMVEQNKCLVEENADVMSFLITNSRLRELFERVRQMERNGVPDPIAYAETINEFAMLGGFEIIETLKRSLVSWGLTKDIIEKPLGTLSGGEQRLIYLLKEFLKRAELYLLDEPTNFLDDHCREILSKAINFTDSTFLIVSHDRWFLDQVVTRILEIERRKVLIYSGNYTIFYETKQRERLEKQREARKIEHKIRHLREVQRRYRIWGMRKEKEKIGAGDKGFISGRAARLLRKSARAKERIEKEIEELKRVKPFVERIHRIRIKDVKLYTGVCVSAFQLVKKFGNKLLFNELSFSIMWGDKVVITGPNGSGKTTLIRILLGEIPPDSGAVEWSKKPLIGYLPQITESPKDTRSPVERFGDDIKSKALDMLGCLGIRGDLLRTSLDRMSEGMRKKVLLIETLISEPEVLILDEPTTHLDFQSIELLQEALERWNGTLILVTHDRYLRERVCNLFITLGN